MFHHNRRILFREILLVFGWLLVGLLLITLASYSPSDPGWSAEGVEDGEVQNRFGVVGAYIADALLSTLGYSAYLLCVIALVALHALVNPSGRVSNERLGGYWSAVGLLLFILSSAALENIRFAAHAQSLPSQAAGGGVGELVADSMLGLFGYTGAAAILLFIWMMSWSLAANLSWFAFCELIGVKIELFICFVAEKVELARAARKGRKAGQERAAAEQSQSRTQGAPVTPFLTVPKRITKPKPKPKPKPAPAEAAPQLPGINQSSEPASQNPTATAEGNSEAPVALPSASLLDAYDDAGSSESEEKLARNSELIEQTLQSFGISAKVLSAHPGPVITRYDIQPDSGVKGAQIVALVRDLARALAVTSIRVLETMPGKSCMGLEIPNHDRATVYFSDLIEDESYTGGEHALPLALGKDAAGLPVTADLAKMPHLLVAGATGSGKSVCINAMLLSLLFSAPPEKLRLILIDPKMLELASYNDIPHLLAPVVTDVSLAPAALNWAVEEMENRYRLMSETGARHIDSYNQIIAESGERTPMPYIVVVIDELADLMMTTGKKAEMTISRLAQKARAAGIHLILATQRPSVDVITGLIKANVPCRIAFQVASKVDSRTIIDQMGADMLLGMGDMLYLPAGSGLPSRVHGAFVSDDEVRRVADHLRAGRKPEYEIDFSRPTAASLGVGDESAESDPVYDQAVEAVLSTNRPSISLVQRKLRIGYNRAARLIETMEQAGIVSPADENGSRKILVQRGDGDGGLEQ